MRNNKADFLDIHETSYIWGVGNCFLITGAQVRHPQNDFYNHYEIEYFLLIPGKDGDTVWRGSGSISDKDIELIKEAGLEDFQLSEYVLSVVKDDLWLKLRAITQGALLAEPKLEKVPDNTIIHLRLAGRFGDHLAQIERSTKLYDLKRRIHVSSQIKALPALPTEMLKIEPA